MYGDKDDEKVETDKTVMMTMMMKLSSILIHVKNIDRYVDREMDR